MRDGARHGPADQGHDRLRPGDLQRRRLDRCSNAGRRVGNRQKQLSYQEVGPCRWPCADGCDRQRDRHLRPVRTQQVPRRRLLHADQAFRQGVGIRLSRPIVRETPAHVAGVFVLSLIFKSFPLAPPPVSR